MNILKSPLLHIVIPIVLAIIINALMYSFKKDYKSQDYVKNKLLPPGYVIGIIWIIILGLLGYSHYLLVSQNNKVTVSSVMIVILVIFCLMYPFMTGGLKKKYSNIHILNLITLIFAFIVALNVILQNRIAFYYMIPLLLWAIYVNIATNPDIVS